ncbi:MAG TPA: hypothetical protein VGV59_18305 [Pyrinomonadaceae bacterium]|nr:hypothetical protein [Pyrinomonadaceae bacterium]
MSIHWDALMWIPGTLLGVSIGILGSFIGIQASRGKLRQSALKLMLAMMAVSAILMVVGVAALLMGQTWGVWYGLLLPGLIGLVVLGANLPLVKKRIQEQPLNGS